MSNTIDLLLGMDTGKVARPKARMEITRLSEAAGGPVIFEIQALTMQQHADIAEMSQGNVIDMRAFAVLEGVVSPDLKDKKLLEKYGAVNPKELLSKQMLLLPGELAAIYNKITELSGFDDGNTVKEVKN